MPSVDYKVVDTCGKGMLLDASGQRVLLLEGSSYQMGFQQGRLLKEQTRELVSTVLTVARARTASQSAEKFDGSIENAFERCSKFIDRRYFEEMQGLADGAELPLEDVHLANIFPELFHCSGFALFGDATEDGSLLHGRILDYMTEIGLQNQAVVTVHKPQDKRLNSFVTVGYAGLLGSVTGMNSKQITIGEMGGGGEGDWDGIPMTFLIRKALEETASLKEAIAMFRDNPRTCEYFYVISDGNTPDAAGLVCTPEVFDVIKPGQEYKKLPTPIEDCVLLSAKDRYKALVERVSAQYGEITVDDALDLMNKPVAMESCLHRVLFQPQRDNIWVSNAADIDSGEDYPAHSQPYYKYNLAQLLSILAENGLNNNEIKPPRSSEKTTAEPRKQPENSQAVTGVVGKEIFRKAPPARDSRLQKLLDDYLTAPESFKYRMEPNKAGKTSKYRIYEVSFPSAFESRSKQNNTVYLEYYDCFIEGKRPAVILLDILDGSMMVSRLIANSLASEGVNSCIMTMPYYGKRGNGRGAFTGGFDTFIDAVRQSVIDIRRTARLLESIEKIDESQIGICGTSLGGIIAALSAGVDGQFEKAAFVLAGGGLEEILTTGKKEVSFAEQEIARNGLDKQRLKALVAPIDPLLYAHRLQGTDLLMINGKTDKIIPPDCAKALASEAGVDIIWYDTDHYGMKKYLLPIIGKLKDHFASNRETYSKD